MHELSLHILDAAENSLQAGATQVEIGVEENLEKDRLTITVRDNGRGMSGEQLARVSDPFFTTRTTRHVGLGVPFFKAAAEQCGGSLTVTSQAGVGTALQAVFQRSHIDRAPLGDMAGTLLMIICSLDRQGRSAADPARPCDLYYIHRVIRPGCAGERTFEFQTADMRAELGDVSLTHPAVRSWLRDFVTEGEESLHPQEVGARRDA